jgi:hypothetical protein
MGHGLTDSDRTFSVRKPPWHALGPSLEDYPHSIDEALAKAGGQDTRTVRNPSGSDGSTEQRGWRARRDSVDVPACLGLPGLEALSMPDAPAPRSLCCRRHKDRCRPGASSGCRQRRPLERASPAVGRSPRRRHQDD